MRTVASTPKDKLAADRGDGADRTAAGACKTSGRDHDALAQRFRETRYGWLVLALVSAACALYLAACLGRGWVPHDAGTMGQTAERVLEGQVPHRDFTAVYTGGLTYLNALALRLFGMNLFSLRIPLFLFFLGWLPAVYLVARRFTGPLTAGALTLLAVAWSVPNYPSPTPSWYNLFFATWGTLALIRYTETEKRRWLWAGGLCGGLSFLAKVTGLYFVAAGLLFLVFHEQWKASPEGERQGRGKNTYRIFASICLLAFLAVVTRMVSRGRNLSSFFDFALPVACLVALLVLREWTGANGPGRFRRLFSLGLPFLGGVLVPVGVFLFLYAWAGAVPAWFDGVFVIPFVRVNLAAFAPPSPLMLVGLVPPLLALYAAYASGANRKIVGAAVIGGFATLLVAARFSEQAYLVLGVSLPLLIPVGAGIALVWLWRSAKFPERKQQQVFLIVAVASVCALIQFPFSNPTYFCYVAPLVILAAASIISMTPGANRVALGGLVAFYLVFAVWFHAPGYFAAMGWSPSKPLAFETLELPRAGGIRVPARQAQEYEEVVHLVQAHARGQYIYAGPDSPEIYFLSGYQNPTRTIFAFLDPDFSLPAERTRKILRAIDRHDINLVVLRQDSEFSGPPPAQLRAALNARYPQSATVGKFEVRWK